jgi:hypothetical protein
MQIRWLAPGLWLGPGLALLVGSYTTSTGIAFLCKLLWLPMLLAGLVQMGLNYQALLQKDGKNVPSFTYRHVLELQPLALVAFLGGTGAFVGLGLLLMYPNIPTTILGWSALLLSWPLVWLFWSWLYSKIQSYRRRSSGA